MATFDKRLHIRKADTSDEESIRQIHLEAFDDDESELVANLACDLLKERTSSGIVNLVAEEGMVLVGHIAFSPVLSKAEGSLAGYLLGPLAVKPSYQRKGIGKELIERGLEELSPFNVGVILVYGDPNYYSRFGFKREVAEKYIPPFQLKHPFGWQGIDCLNEASHHDPLPIACVEALNKPELW